MPRRTNDFQELVELIQRAYARPGDSVTPSAMVKVVGLETEREVDVLHETTAGSFRIKIAIEPKDEARPIDLTTFESLAAKYRGEGRVTVDKFVLVARNGFTAGAIEKARLMDVTLLTLQEARGFDWASLGPHHAQVAKPNNLNFKVGPHICGLVFRPAIPPALEKEASTKGRIICPHGHDHGTPIEYANHLLQCHVPPEERAKFLNALNEEARKDPAGAHALVSGPLTGYKLRLEGTDFPLEELGIRLHAIDATTPVECTSYERRAEGEASQVVHHLKAKFGETVIEWVMPDGLRAPQIALRVRDAKASPKGKAAQHGAQGKRDDKQKKRQTKRKKG